MLLTMLEAKTEPFAGRLVKTAARTAVQISPLSANIASLAACSCKTVFKKKKIRTLNTRESTANFRPRPLQR